jgi:hypothetical protein
MQPASSLPLEVMDGHGARQSLQLFLGPITGPWQIFYVHKIQKLRNQTARPRTPTAVLELRGAFRRNPNRRRKFEPRISTALPEPPPRLPKPVESAWLEMQGRGYWLTSADRFLVEIAATLMARYRFEEIKSGDVSQLIQLLGRLGFAP